MQTPISLLYSKEYAIAGLWHEIGHIDSGIFDRDINQEELRRDRYVALSKGVVHDIELEADCFALKYTGKNRLIQFLQYCKANRMRIKDGNYELALKEFDLRINAIKRQKI